MSLSSIPPNWVDRVDRLVWGESADHLAAHAADLEREMAGEGVGAAGVLAELCDESLALCIQKQFWPREAFEVLFVNRYLAYLGRWFYRWGVKPEQARDLSQDLFCRFLQNRLKTFEPTGHFRGYLRQAAWNLVADVRRRSRPALPLDPLAEPADEHSTIDEASCRELRERTEQALGRLPEREEFVLRQTMGGEEPAAIADRMNLSPRRVFSLLFQARRRMEKELGLPPVTRKYRKASESQPHQPPRATEAPSS